MALFWVRSPELCELHTLDANQEGGPSRQRTPSAAPSGTRDESDMRTH